MTGDDLLDIAPCGYLWFDDGGTIEGCNLTLANWLGYDKNDLRGKSVESIFTIATRIFYNTHFFPLIKLHSHANEIFITLSDRKKNDIPVLTNAERREHNGKASIHCVFLRVSERKKYEEELLAARRRAEMSLEENQHLKELKESYETQARELDKQLQRQLMLHSNLLEFSKIVSHDLHEPLRKIQVFTGIIETEQTESLTPKSRSAIGKILNSVERLRALTAALRQYTSIEDEKHVAEISLTQIVRNAVRTAVDKNQFANFDLQLENLPHVYAYGAQLELLFFHLFDNSIKFRDPARPLIISVTSTILQDNAFKEVKNKYNFIDHVRIRYHDTSIGFDNEYRDYVLEFFKKMNPASEGIGIGLSLIKRIIQNHSGSLFIESEKGHGTSLTITFPLDIR